MTSVAQNIMHLKRRRRKWWWRQTCLRYYPGTFVYGLSKTTKTLRIGGLRAEIFYVGPPDGHAIRCPDTCHFTSKNPYHYGDFSSIFLLLCGLSSFLPLLGSLCGHVYLSAKLSSPASVAVTRSCLVLTLFFLFMEKYVDVGRSLPP
jgi:hypothetical protein